jgi:hypothetical protein
MPLTRIQSLGITDGTIVNADINASAAIDGTKLTGVGKVLQVVSTTVSAALALSVTSSYSDITGLSASITPSSSANKILILYKILMCNTSGGNGTIRLNRNGTAIGLGDAGTGQQATVSMNFANSNNYWAFDFGGSFLDSPSSTSALTYKFTVRNEFSTTVHFNRTSRLASDDILGISTITLMEIKG